VILDGPASTTITAKPAGDKCAVNVAAAGSLTSRPAVVTLDASCAVTPDPSAATAATAAGTRPTAPTAGARSPRSGCCGAQSTPGSPIAMTLVVLAIVLRRRVRRAP
jgi:uncharacterized protein (TIGR03382 family)